MAFPDGSDGKESACDAGDPGSIPGLGRSPGEGNGYSLQCSCLENPMDRGTWQATILGIDRHSNTVKQGTFFALDFVFSDGALSERDSRRVKPVVGIHRGIHLYCHGVAVTDKFTLFGFHTKPGKFLAQNLELG